MPALGWTRVETLLLLSHRESRLGTPKSLVTPDPDGAQTEGSTTQHQIFEAHHRLDRGCFGPEPRSDQDFSDMGRRSGSRPPPCWRLPRIALEEVKVLWSPLVKQWVSSSLWSVK